MKDSAVPSPTMEAGNKKIVSNKIKSSTLNILDRIAALAVIFKIATNGVIIFIPEIVHLHKKLP
jgi:hypothetical protein